jgi:hypothetical protein
MECPKCKTSRWRSDNGKKKNSSKSLMVLPNKTTATMVFYDERDSQINVVAQR